jgi:hypothetical protein
MKRIMRAGYSGRCARSVWRPHVRQTEVSPMKWIDYAPRRLDGEQLFQAAEADVDAEVIDCVQARGGDDRTENNGGQRIAS